MLGRSCSEFALGDPVVVVIFATVIVWSARQGWDPWDTFAVPSSMHDPRREQP